MRAKLVTYATGKRGFALVPGCVRDCLFLLTRDRLFPIRS